MHINPITQQKKIKKDKHTSIHDAKLPGSQHFIREYLVHRGNILHKIEIALLLNDIILLVETFK